MARFLIRTNSVTPQLTQARKVLTNLRPLLATIGQLIVASIREEFAGGFWKRPTGGRLSWPPRKPFGDDPGGPSRLQQSGALLEGWTNPRVTENTVFVQNDLPYAAVHRPTDGAGRVSAQPTVIKAQKIGAKGLPSMFWFLGLTKGVWISPEKLLNEGLTIPARPHATNNPDLRDKVRDTISRELFA